MKKLLYILVVVVSFAFISNEWEKVNANDDESIIVYNRDLEGYDLPQSKVESVLPVSSIQKCVAFMQDFDNYKVWIPNCYESKLLKKEGNKFIYYTKYNAPWPVSDRDLIVESEFVVSKEKLIIYQMSKPDYIPEKDDYVRVPLQKATWVFELINGKVKYKNESLSSPGGNIPDFLAARAAEDIPLEMTEGIIKEIVKY